MAPYYLVEHKDWDEPRKIFSGPDLNREKIANGLIQTFGSSPDCKWTLPDQSLPDIVAIVVHHRYRRNYVCELLPEDYGSTDYDDFLKQKPVLRKVVENFDVAGYRFLTRHQGVDPNSDETQISPFDRLRAAYIKTWDGHMSPGDVQGFERDQAAHEAWTNGEDIYEIIRKERGES